MDGDLGTSVSNRKVFLASGSPRRQYLLEQSGFSVVVEPQDADETWPGGDPGVAAQQIALRKIHSAGPQDLPVIGADTVVVLDGIPLGKPQTAREAHEMLGALSGKCHLVITGVGIATASEERSFSVSTRVWFRDLSSEEIARYVDSGDCFDKAGSYGIQSGGSVLVDRVEGSYTNVIGLPLRETLEALEGMV